MNLAEFPITLLTDHPGRGVKTLVFEDQQGKLTVSGSDDFGLPTALDADVIVGLIQLTKIKNDFFEPKVLFTRYELLKLLGWPDQKQQYRRLDDSLRRWVGVTLRYDRSWWDNEVKCRVDANFHILDSVVLFDQAVRRTLLARHQPVPLSSFTWNRIFFESCRADNLKRLDLKVYFALRSAVSKRLYRLLDKRFHVNNDWKFDLLRLAFTHIGLSPNYTAAKVKEKLKPALEELEGIGFLEPMTSADRYAKRGRGAWQIRLVHKRTPTPVATPPEPEPTSLEQTLIDRGVSLAYAAQLVREFPEDRIRAQVEQVDWLREQRPKKVKDVGAYLAEAIRKDFATPAGFRSPAERTEAEATARAQQDQQERARGAKARMRESKAQIASSWEGLTPDERERIDAEALAQADPETRADFEAETRPVLRRMKLSAIRHAYLESEAVAR